MDEATGAVSLILFLALLAIESDPEPQQWKDPRNGRSRK